MILGFKEQFKPLILNGSKIHTIREDKHNRWKVGNLIHFATGVRTKNYNRFKMDVCKSVQKIQIKYDLITGTLDFIKIDNITLVKDEIRNLAVLVRCRF